MNINICGTLIGMLKQIAIDGPVASGKTTVGRSVSHALGWRFLDTGLMYRAATWLILEKTVRLDQPKEMSAATAQANMGLISHGETDVLLVDGVNIMRELRTLRVEETVSHVSKVSGVRKALINQQRIIARQGPIVMVGRDVGTVVLPNAPVKVYLEAPPDVRAFRRYTERLSDKENSTLEKVKLEIGNRDRIDSGRKESPLYPAKDAIVIDTSSLTINDVVGKILKMTKL
ncbi:MAG: (d)CMP kinase [Dehalococcoidia bacterium]|nr:(d)CMP kinase [Dehalococcoidia bacterium]